MKKHIKILLIAIALILSFNSFVFCETAEPVATESQEAVENGANDENTATDENTAQKEEAKSEKEFKLPEKGVVLATINDYEILSDEVNDLYFYLSRQYASSGIDISSAEISKQIYDMALDTAIQKYVVLQKAKELNLDKPSDEEKADIEKKSKEFYDNTFNSVLKSRLKDDADEETKKNVSNQILEEMKNEDFTVENIISSNIEDYAIKKLQESIVKDINVTDEEIQKYYQEKVDKEKELYSSNIVYYEQAMMRNVPTWYTPAGYRGIKHILLKVDDELLKSYNSLKAESEEESNIHNDDNSEKKNVDSKKINPEDLEQARQKIMDSVADKVNEIKEKIKNNVSFDELLSEYGQDPGMNVEPYKTEGYRVNKDSLLYDPAFTKAAFTIDKINEYSEPVIGMYGVHILYYASDIPEGPVALTDDNKVILEKEIYNNKSSEKINNTLTEWLKEFKIEKKDVL